MLAKLLVILATVLHNVVFKKILASLIAALTTGLYIIPFSLILADFIVPLFLDEILWYSHFLSVNDFQETLIQKEQYMIRNIY